MAGPPNTQYGIVGSRLGFRLNYLSAALSAARQTHAIFRLDDLPVKVRLGSVTIHDVINDTPDTCTLTIDAATPPHTGQRLTIRLNSNAPRTLFAGPLQTVDLSYELQPHQTVYPCQAIDDTPVANRKLPYGQWVNTSATTIGQWLVTNFCPANYSSAGVQASLPNVSVNFDSTEGMDGCLRQLAKLIGGYFYWDDRTLHLFQDGEPGDTPDPIDALHPFLNDPPIAVSVDTSQVRTRVYGKGYAEAVIADVAAGDPIVPISNAVMFNPAGGQAVTETQRLRYTGTDAGGGGTVVGPGIAPVAAPVVALAAGTGVTVGTHDYAVSFTTAAGESLPGPRATMNVTGTLAVGTIAPTLQKYGAGGGPGPNAGVLYYATSWVTSSGETIPWPLSVYTQPTIAAGVSGISVADHNDGFGYGTLHPGDHLAFYYSYSSLSGTPNNGNPSDGTNQTPIGPASAGYIVKQAPGLTPGYGMAFSLQIPLSPDPNVQTFYVWVSVNFQPMTCVAIGIGGQGYAGLNRHDLTSYFWAYVGGSFSTPTPPTVFNPIVGGVAVSTVQTGPAGVTARRLYRTTANGGQLQLLATIGDNTTTTYSDVSPDSALGVNAPTVNTATAAQVNISAIPLGPATVTGRRLYRTAAGGSQLKLLTGLGDNTTTAISDVVADASLGANAPTSDTSGIQQPAGTVLAGAASIVVAGVGWARAAGGWAIIGNGQQTIRYTGISGNTLTGIPPTGPGAIVASVSFNSTITAAALLLGVTGLLRALIKGAPMNLWVQRDDLTAQAAVAADGTDGVIEHLITDERRGEASLSFLCDADLAQYAYPIQTVPYATRDVKTKSGKPITFNLASPAIAATLTIQEVTITEIDIAVGLNPKFTATASSVRFSLEDMLRRLGASLDVTS